MKRDWYYLDSAQQQQGPYSEDDLVRQIQRGVAPSDALIWTKGMSKWLPADQVQNIVHGVSLPPRPDQEQVDNSMYFHIPVTRLFFLSACSWGLYEWYWMWKNWTYAKERRGYELGYQTISPIWRSIFDVVWIRPLLVDMGKNPEAEKILPMRFNGRVLGLLYFGFILIERLALKYVTDESYRLYAIFISYPTFLLLLPVQRYYNRVNALRDPKPEFAEWTTPQVLMLFGGLVITVFMLALAFRPDLLEAFGQRLANAP